MPEPDQTDTRTSDSNTTGTDMDLEWEKFRLEKCLREAEEQRKHWEHLQCLENTKRETLFRCQIGKSLGTAIGWFSPLLIVVIPLVFGWVSTNNANSEARAKEAEARIAANKSEVYKTALDSRKKYYETQTKTYQEAISAVSKIIGISSPSYIRWYPGMYGNPEEENKRKKENESARDAAIGNFEILYWAKLPLVEDEEIGKSKRLFRAAMMCWISERDTSDEARRALAQEILSYEQEVTQQSVSRTSNKQFKKMRPNRADVDFLAEHVDALIKLSGRQLVYNLRRSLMEQSAPSQYPEITSYFSSKPVNKMTPEQHPDRDGRTLHWAMDDVY